MRSNNITIIRGDTPTISVTIVDSEDALFDLTGYDVNFTVKEMKMDSNSDALIGPETMTVATPASGIATLKLSDTDTNLSEGEYWYDIEISKTGTVYTVVGPATFKVTEDITK